MWKQPVQSRMETFHVVVGSRAGIGEVVPHTKRKSRVIIHVDRVRFLEKPQLIFSREDNHLICIAITE